MFSRLVRVINSYCEETNYTYDPAGNMLAQKDGAGNITTFEYNTRNLPVRKIDHGGRLGVPGNFIYLEDKTESYSYNADGSIHTKTDRNGVITTYTYDIYGRLVSESAGSGASTDTITYTYDNNGNQLTMTDSTGTTTRTYDSENRVVSKTVPDIGVSTYVYDLTSGLAAGYVAETSSDPKGNSTMKVYDKAGRLKEVSANGGTTTYEYYSTGSTQSIVYPNGSREDYTYYSDSTLHTLVNKRADGTVIDSYSYAYDDANNQISKTDAKGTTTYSYDSLNRLKSVTQPSSKATSYTYDKAGNRLTETVTYSTEIIVTTYKYNEQNRLEWTLTQSDGISEKTP